MHHTDKYSEHGSIIRASLAKWLSVRLRTKWFWVRVQLQSLYLQKIALHEVNLEEQQKYLQSFINNATYQSIDSDADVTYQTFNLFSSDKFLIYFISAVPRYIR